MTRIGEVLHRAGISDALPFWLGQALLLEGRWQELSRGVGPIMDAIAGTNPWMWKALLWLPALQGDVDVTEQQIRFVLPRGQDTQPGSVHYDSAMAVISVAARMELGRGWIAAARAWLEMHDRWITWAGDARSRSFGALLWAEYFRASGDPEEARQRAERSLELAADLHQPLVVLAAQRLLGELDTAAGLTIEATSWLSQSLELATACAAPFERALTLLALAELRAAEGNRDEARMLIDEVRSICESLGARPTLARVDVLVEQIESAPVSYPAGLTAREVDVLRLIAQGLTDADVAEQLFIARRTVNTHLTSIYTKLSVSSRAAATRFAVEHGLT